MKRETIIGAIVGATAIIVAYYLLRRASNGTGPTGGGGTASPAPDLTEGAIAPGGIGGTGGSASFSSLAELAAAVDRLAAGVKVPIFQTKSVTLSAAGRVNIAPAESGKQIRVFAHCVTTASGTSDKVYFWSGSSNVVYPMRITPVAGTTGANLATSWPSYLFASNTGEGIDVVADGACTVVVTYWSE